MDGAKVTIKDSASIHSNGTISGSGASQILVSGKDSHDVYSSVTMEGGTISGTMIRSLYGIELKNSTTFTINNGYIDVYGLNNGIYNKGTFTVNGGVVEAEAEWDKSLKKRAYSAIPVVKDTMVARQGDLKATAHDVALSKVNWESRYIYLGTGYRAEIKYVLYGGTLPEGAPASHIYGTTTVLPIPTRDGYIFDGWYDDSALTLGPITEIGADITGSGDLSFTFHAKWTKISEWNEPTYDWTETATGYECTATRTHKTDAGKVETETVTAVYREVSAATCDYDGYGVYLATFTNTAFKEQIKQITLPKGHIWETPRYNWNQTAAGYNCTATRICYRNWEHVETETVVATLIEGTSATCTEGGHGKYSAIFTNPAFAEQTEEFDSPATGHAWAEPTYDWNQTLNGYNCTAKRVCTNFASHVETETVTATYAEITPATEEADGLGRYTATFENAAFAQQTKDVTLPKIVHDWSDGITYRWEGEYCIASRTCKNHGETESEKVKGVYSVEIEPGCTTPGRGKYVAHFTNPVFFGYGSPVKTINLPALGHDWGTPSISWREEPDGEYICDAVHYCNRNEEHFEASSTLATYEVITEPTCEADGLGRYTAVFALADFETQTKDVVLPKSGHDWNAATYEWTEIEDGYTVTAKRICKNNAEHIETETVNAVYTIATPPTCLADGIGRYTAEFKADWAKTQIRNIPLESLGHNWSEVTYTWIEQDGGYAVRAYRECKNAGCDYVGRDQETAKYAVVTPATCLEDGLGRYTVEFHYDWAETRTKDVVLKATGHDWAEPTYVWTEANGGYTVTAKRICKNDANHVETETVKAAYAVITPETCLTEGLGRYTAEFKADWAETQTKDVVLKATGHNWAEPTYVWTEANGGYTVTAKRICNNDGKHIETETVTAAYAVITEQTCVKDGLGRYTAAFENAAFAKQTKDVVIPKNGHNHSGRWIYNDFEHWKICPVCKEIIDLEAHDLTDWRKAVKRGDTNADYEERHCRICPYYQNADVIHISANGGKNSETNPNTGAEVVSFVPLTAMAVCTAAAAVFGKKK